MARALFVAKNKKNHVLEKKGERLRPHPPEQTGDLAQGALLSSREPPACDYVVVAPSSGNEQSLFPQRAFFNMESD